MMKQLNIKTNAENFLILDKPANLTTTNLMAADKAPKLPDTIAKIATS